MHAAADRAQLWQELKGVEMVWLDRREVAMVERDDDAGADSLGKSDHAGVGAAQREVCVGFHELGDSNKILGGWAFDVENAEAAQESRLGSSAQAPTDEVGCFSDSERGDNEAHVGAPMPHLGWVDSVAFSPDGSQVLTAADSQARADPEICPTVPDAAPENAASR